MNPRGGPQLIPRPAGNRPGEPAPWAHLPAAQRSIDLAGIRRAFAGRVGVPSSVEGHEAVRPSAVLAGIWDHEGSTEILLTRRSLGLRSHRGEVAFPGGRADPGETLLGAALREASEEVGLDPATVDVLGQLDHLMTVSSKSFIVPFVALLPDRPVDLVPNPQEVDAVLFTPLDELLLDEVYREELWTWPQPPAWVDDGVTQRPIFFFELVGDTVWGATGAMLRQLLGLALRLDVSIDHR